jgi:maltose O-acetyltransferase
MESRSVQSGPVARLKKIAIEELGSVLSRRSLVWLASALPTQAFDRSRTALLRRAGVQIGPRSLIQGTMHVTGAGKNPCLQISIGSFTLISGSLHCDVGASISIGDRVRIGHDVSLLTVDHQVGPGDMRSGQTKYGPIEIGDGAWLASRVVVLPGIRIGAGAIVAAGSVVTRDVPDHTLVVGVPARVARNLNAEPEPEGAEPPVSSRRFLRQA